MQIYPSYCTTHRMFVIEKVTANVNESTHFYHLIALHYTAKHSTQKSPTYVIAHWKFVVNNVTVCDKFRGPQPGELKRRW